MRRVEKIHCGKCNGRGYEIVTRHIHEDGVDMSGKFEQVCLVCRGTGEQPKEGETQILSTADEMQAAHLGQPIKKESGSFNIELVLKAISDKVQAIDRFIRSPQRTHRGVEIDAEEWAEFKDFKQKKREYMERLENERITRIGKKD